MVTVPILPPTPDAIAEAGALLRAGRLVAFPTETVYGLGGNALDGRAVAGIFAAKGRPSFNPLIVHVPDLAAAERLAVLGPPARRLAETFWPGPLTLVLRRRPDSGLSDLVTAGLDTVAIRIPSHPVAQAVLLAAGVPIAAPSANRSGHVSATTAVHVAEDFGEGNPPPGGGRTPRHELGRASSTDPLAHARTNSSWARQGGGEGDITAETPPPRNAIELSPPVECSESASQGGLNPWPSVLPPRGGGGEAPATLALIIDGGPAAHGVESTVLDATGEEIVLLRPGAVTTEAIEAVLGAKLGRSLDGGDRPMSPGQLASHYAPRARVRLEATDVQVGEALLAFGPGAPSTAGPALNLSPTGDLMEAAANLFAALRALDATGVAGIAVMPIPRDGLGEAINDRLARAAVGR